MRWIAWVMIAGACSGGSGDPVDGGRDSGQDARLDTPRVMDAAGDVAIDAGQDTAADTGFDAGFDAGPPCMCPTLPATCDVISLDPVFSPDDPNFGQELMQLLACADTSIHAALYDVTWDCIVDAFAARLAADDDLQIDIVVDDDNCPDMGGGVRGCALNAIASHPRVTIIDDNRSSLMHHKFILVDNLRVWVSSANMTRNSFCNENNNSVVLEQAEMVVGYENVFQRMFFDLNFSPVPIEGPVLGGVYALYFSPQTPTDAPSNWFNDLVGEIAASTRTLDIMIFALTRTEISNALIAAHGRGVVVRVLTSPRFRAQAAVQALADAGIDVRTASVHHKVLISDGATVITGSANWSANAWQNSENSLWIGDADTAASYILEMDRIWAGAAE